MYKFKYFALTVEVVLAGEDSGGEGTAFSLIKTLMLRRVADFAYADHETGKLTCCKKLQYAAVSLPSISVPNILVGSFVLLFYLQLGLSISVMTMIMAVARYLCYFFPPQFSASD
jgi:hypothetical protein